MWQPDTRHGIHGRYLGHNSISWGQRASDLAGRALRNRSCIWPHVIARHMISWYQIVSATAFPTSLQCTITLSLYSTKPEKRCLSTFWTLHPWTRTLTSYPKTSTRNDISSMFIIRFLRNWFSATSVREYSWSRTSLDKWWLDSISRISNRLQPKECTIRTLIL
jgi:hypothetical protein